LEPEALYGMAFYIGKLWCEIPRRACMPIRAVVVLRPKGIDGWLEGDETTLTFSGSAPEVLRALIQQAEEKAGMRGAEPDLDLLGFRWWPESWRLESLLSLLRGLALP
jgi:hypothetical protein